MITITTQSNSFTINGNIQYQKGKLSFNFSPNGIVSIYNLNAHFSNVSIDGKIYATINELKTAINDKLFNEGGGNGNGVTETKYNNSALSVGFWTIGSGAVIGEKSTNASYKCVIIPVFKNDKISLKGYIGGASNARAWAVTDMDLNILSRASTTAINLITNPIELTISTDGYLYVNSTLESSSTIDITVTRSITQFIEEQISAVNNNIKEISTSYPIFRNNQLPTNNTTLKVLAIGNSYTNDMTTYCNSFITSAGIDASNICIYTATIGGSSILTWLNAYNNNTEITEYERKAGSITMTPTSLTVKDILSQDWDVIVTQQVSSSSADFVSISRDLPILIKRIKENCTNQKVAIAWHSVWSYTQAFNATFWGVEGWKKICEVSRQVANKIGVNIIIPTGTAIQNARLVTTPVINGGNGLTRDGTHLQFGTGRYIASATFFYSIISPIFNKHILNNGSRYALNSSDLLNEYSIAVNETNFLVCQRSAFLAVNDMWNINT